MMAKYRDSKETQTTTEIKRQQAKTAISKIYRDNDYVEKLLKKFNVGLLEVEELEELTEDNQ